MTSPTVALKGVSRAFGRTQALAPTSIDLTPGVTGLLGPNGAGKTTLLRILATVLAHDDGTIRVLDLDPTSPDERTEIRRRLGYLPQEVGLHRSFTAFEFVDYVAILKEHADLAATRTVVLSTHQTEDVAALCNQVVVLLDDAVAFHGTPAELVDPTIEEAYLLLARHAAPTTEEVGA